MIASINQPPTCPGSATSTASCAPTCTSCSTTSSSRRTRSRTATRCARGRLDVALRPVRPRAASATSPSTASRWPTSGRGRASTGTRCASTTARAAHFDEEAPFWEEIYARRWERLLDLQRTTLDQALARSASGPSCCSSAALRRRGTPRTSSCSTCAAASARPSTCPGRWAATTSYPSRFDAAGIELRFHDFAQPTYPQAQPGFEPYMAALDAILCLGATGAASCWRPRRDHASIPVGDRASARAPPASSPPRWASTTTATWRSRTRSSTQPRRRRARGQVPELPHRGLRPRPLDDVRVHVAAARRWSESQYDMFKRCELSSAALRELREHCDGAEASSSPRRPARRASVSCAS